MPKTVPFDFSSLLLQLYGLSQALAIDEFQDAALTLIKPVLPFDTAMWGSGTLHPAGLDVHHLHLHRTSHDMLLAYDAHKTEDLAAFSVGQHRSATGAFHSPVFYAGNPGLRDFMQRFGHQNLFISGDTDPDTRYTQWLSLYRADIDAHCHEEERLRLQQLRPHLMQALAMNRRLHLVRLATAFQGGRQGLAVADLRGVLNHADAVFAGLLQGEWPGWRPDRLPAALVQGLVQGECLYRGASLVVHGHVEHQLQFLRARPRCKADMLSEREFEVASLVAQGHSHKAVAQQLGRAPATVRNHVQAIYAKLEVNNVAGLLAALRQANWV